MDISVIIVNFRSRQFLLNCISSIEEKFKGFSWEVIIVNNDTEEIENIFLKNSNIRVLNTHSNLGFGNACNDGARMALGKILFFLNPDTEIIKFEFDKLYKKFKSEKLGILSPFVYLPSGSLQPWTAGEEVNLGKLIRTKLGLHKDISFQKDKNEFDWVSGAAFFILKDLFLENNGFDTNFFMYFEDMDLCLRIKKLGYKIARSDNFEILHIGGQSYSNNKLQKKHYYSSQDYYFQKHFGYMTVFAVRILRKFFLLFNKKA